MGGVPFGKPLEPHERQAKIDAKAADERAARAQAVLRASDSTSTPASQISGEDRLRRAQQIAAVQDATTRQADVDREIAAARHAAMQDARDRARKEYGDGFAMAPRDTVAAERAARATEGIAFNLGEITNLLGHMVLLMQRMGVRNSSHEEAHSDGQNETHTE